METKVFLIGYALFSQGRGSTFGVFEFGWVGDKYPPRTIIEEQIREANLATLRDKITITSISELSSKQFKEFDQ